MLRTLAFAVLISSGAVWAQSGSNSLCGTVQNENGAPAKAILISAFRSQSTGPMPATRTDEQGHYCFKNLVEGAYFVSASDAKNGYPDLGATLFGQGRHAKYITVGLDHPSAIYDFRIPYKAAFLHFAFTEVVSGRAIEPPSMTASMAARSDPESRWMRDNSSATKTILVPPDEDISITVAVEGYEVLPGDGFTGTVVNYAPGSSHTFTVKLLAIPATSSVMNP